MTTTLNEIDYETWVDTYKPLTNSRGEIRMFETYGEDLDIVKITDNKHIWTWTDGGDYSVITNGFSFVNRMGYYLCAVAYQSEEHTIEIDLYEPNECDKTGCVYVPHQRYDGTPVMVCQFCEGEPDEELITPKPS